MYSLLVVMLCLCVTAEELPVQAAAPDRPSYVSCSDELTCKSILCLVTTALELVWRTIPQL